ncbi:MAG: hypothetical protein JNG89_20820 [Planctomycetaceae bacterium]|nr:hypothetical protein [Planctomycetaceae bacterium]
MANTILYMGDTAIDGAAAYLGGVMTHAGLRFDYRPSDAALRPEDVATAHALYIVSDYAAKMIATPLQERIVEHVSRGAGLLMLGGWESFCGLGGDWSGTPIANILPVEIGTKDDRRNCDDLVLVHCETENHPITRSLPWTTRPPIIGGFNEVRAKPDGGLLLTARRQRPRFDGDTVQLAAGAVHPLLVTGVHGHGRTAALMTDVAPHWVGPLVDWGDQRVQAKAPGSSEIEVGDLYAQFVTQLVGWTLHR